MGLKMKIGAGTFLMSLMTIDQAFAGYPGTPCPSSMAQAALPR